MSETRELQVILSSGEVTSTYQGGITSDDKYLTSSEIDAKIVGGEVTSINVAAYALLITDTILSVSYAGACTITIPTAQITNGRRLVIKDAGGLAGTNNITIATEGAETIDGSATAVINSDYSAINIYSDGTNLYIY